VKFNIDIQSNFKYQMKNREVKFDSETNEINHENILDCFWDNKVAFKGS